MARQPTFIFDPYGLRPDAIDLLGERASIFDESGGSLSQRFGPAHLFGAVIEEFSRRKGVGVTSQAKIILISIALELTVTRNIGSVANPKKADGIRFLGVAKQMVGLLDYIAERLGGTRKIKIMGIDDDISWISEVFRVNEKGNLMYTPNNFDIGGYFPDTSTLYRGVSVEIDATTVVAWLPDFVKSIECSCWPV